MKKATLLLAIVFFSAYAQKSLFSQNTWYVRPAFSGQTYGTEDGTSYANAWNGLETLNGKFQDGTIGPTDEIYVCGTHIFYDTTSNNAIAPQGKIGIKSGQDSLNHLLIRGDYPGDPGVIWGHSRMDYEPWVDRGNNVWSIYVHANYRWNWYFQDVETTGADPNSVIVLNAVGSLASCQNTPGSTYSATYANDSIYVHLTDGGNPTNRVYAPWFGYSFDFDNYINSFSPLHYITFKNLKLYDFSITSNMAYTHVRFDGCTFWWSPGDAIRFFKYQDYNEVVNCDIGWCADGIYGIDDSDEGGANYIYIANNHFHDTGIYPEHQNGDEHAIGAQGGTGWIIEDNYIERCGSGPVLYAYTNQRLTNFIVRRNFIKTCDPDGSTAGYGLTMQCDAYSLSDKSGTQIYQNIVVDCWRAFYLNYEDGIDVFNNVTYNCDYSFRTTRNLPPGTYYAVDMKNNISYNPNNAHIEFISGTTPMNSDYNLFYPDNNFLKFIPVNGNTGVPLADWQLFSYSNNVFDPNSTIGDPLFENASGTLSEPADFKLTAFSPAVNAGTDVGLTTDFAGNPIVGTPDIGAYEYQSSLAVEYKDAFNAKIMGEQVQLTWSTVTEINSDYFDIERATNFKNWKKIRRIESKGNTSITPQYVAYDATPLNGTSYYRLKQMDIDGTYAYSNISTVFFENGDFEIHPNPANSFVEVSFSKNVNAKIQVLDILGKFVFQKTINGLRSNLDLSYLPVGTYFINIETNRGIATKKIVLQK